jgi:GntR family transcriptional regulator/MocR family aminotransferase
MLRTTRGLHSGPEQLVVTRGSQMALYLVAHVLLRPGDVVAVEHPGFATAWNVFRGAGARVIPIAVDGAGLRVDRLAALCRRERVRAVFLTPHHQFPTTVPLSAGRRIELLALAARARLAVIEDDFDHEFHYDGRPLLPLASADRSGVVIYLGSLSKIFAPGLRVGYLVGPTPLIERVRALRQLIDIQDDGVLDCALTELFEEGELQRHLNRTRRIYHARRDFLVETLARRLGGALELDAPSGGMALWARVSPDIDVERWAARARAGGLIFRTGRVFFLDAEPRPFVRLGFARLDEGELAKATAALCRALPH